MTCWRLDAGAQTLLLSSPDGGLPEAVYWGPSLPPDEDTAEAAAAARQDLARGMLDALPPPLALP